MSCSQLVRIEISLCYAQASCNSQVIISPFQKLLLNAGAEISLVDSIKGLSLWPITFLQHYCLICGEWVSSQECFMQVQIHQLAPAGAAFLETRSQVLHGPGRNSPDLLRNERKLRPWHTQYLLSSCRAAQALQAELLPTEQHRLKPITVAGNKRFLCLGQELVLLSFVMSAPLRSYASAKPSIKLCRVKLPTEQLHCREPTNQRVLKQSQKASAERAAQAAPRPTAPRRKGELHAYHCHGLWEGALK